MSYTCPTCGQVYKYKKEMGRCVLQHEVQYRMNKEFGKMTPEERRAETARLIQELWE